MPDTDPLSLVVVGIGALISIAAGLFGWMHARMNRLESRHETEIAARQKALQEHDTALRASIRDDMGKVWDRLTNIADRVAQLATRDDLDKVVERIERMRDFHTRRAGAD